MFVGRYRGIKLSTLSIETKWWPRSNDKISEVISLFSSIQSSAPDKQRICVYYAI